MEDLIRISDAIDLVYKARRADPINGTLTDTMSWAIAAVQAIPAVEPKQGEWEEVPYKRQGHEEIVIDGISWRCTNCGSAEKRNDPDMNYCPNCGARMKGADDEVLRQL